MSEGAPILAAALFGRCPRCGKGSVFRGLLEVRDACAACGLDLRAHDAGDGPAVAGILLIGAIAVVLAVRVDLRYAPPLWLHAVLWPAVVLPLSLLTMRIAKGALIALHWRHRRDRAA